MPRINKRKLCAEEGCTTRPSFNFPDETSGLYCFKDKKPGMENVTNKKCAHPDCPVTASFNFPSERTKLYCADHIKPGMINLTITPCKHPSCPKQPRYNLPGEKAAFCKDHKEPDMIDVYHKTCLKCDKRPSCNLPGLKPIYCGEHKLPDMVNVESKRCQDPTCTSLNPVFNHVGETIGIFCFHHKLPGMVDVKNRKCAHEDCPKQPRYNDVGETLGLYCADHKETTMVNVVDRKCLECNKTPHYNHPSEKVALYCDTHKEPGMINIISRRCTDCDAIHPRYGAPGKTPIHCPRHKVAGDILKPKSKCTSDGCTENALYGIGCRPQACERHKNDDMRNLVEHPCTSCQLTEVLDEKGLCSLCNPEMIDRVRLAKQRMVSNYLTSNGIEWISEDRQLADASACDFKKRPDFLFDASTHFLVVEVDEYQHKGRNCECEQVRMMNMTQVLGLPTIFIRWNPDDYTPTKGTEVPLSTRLDELVRVIKHFQRISPSKVFPKSQSCGAVYMYFDGDKNVEHKHINILG